MFDWVHGESGWQGQQGGTQSISMVSVHSMDIQGDGFDDLVYFDSATARWKVLPGSINGYGSVLDTQIASPALIAKAVPVDADFDGRIDLMVPDGTTWKLLQYTAGGTYSYTNTGMSVLGPHAAAADVNGDGYPDFMNTSGSQLYIFSGSGSGGFATTSQLAWTGPSAISFLASSSGINHRVDFDGDGRQDLIVKVGSYYEVLYSNGSTFSADTVHASSAPIVPINLNADGCTDILAVYPPESIYYASASACNRDGGSAFRVSHWPQIFNSSGNPLAVEWENDGVQDIAFVSTPPLGGPMQWFVGLGGGSNPFAAGPANLSIPASGVTLFVSDIDGDSQTDLTHLDSSGVVRYHRHAGTKPELLATVTDGYRNTVSFNHQSTSAGHCTTRTAPASAANSGNHGSSVPFHVVCGMTASDGTGGTYTVSYTYDNPKINRQGRGFVGFSRRGMTDSRTGSARQEDYRQDFPYIGRVSYRVDRQQSGVKIHEVSNTLASTTFGSGFAATHFPYVETAVANMYEMGGSQNGAWITSETSTVVVDSYGNPTTVTVITQDKDLLSPQYNTSYTNQTVQLINNNTASWCLGRPHQTTLTESLGATSRVHTQIAVVDYPMCRVTQEVVEPSSAPMKLTADYEYLPEGCGNVTAVTITGNSSAGTALPQRKTSFNYGSACRFPESVTDPLNQVTRYDYHYDLGVLNWMKDPNWSSDTNGLKTEWIYDNFGRQTRENRIDGTATTITLSTCNAANSYCGASDLRVRADITELGSNGSTIRSAIAFYDAMERYRLGGAQLANGLMSHVNVTYDSRGNIKDRSEPYASSSTGKTEFEYDLVGRIKYVRLRDANNALLRESSIAYAGRTISFTDPRSKTMQKVFDVIGNLRKVIDPTPSGTTQYGYSYSGSGDLDVTVTDPAGNITSTKTNLRGFAVQTSDPNRGTWSYTYNSLGELSSQTDAKSQTVTFDEYDLLGRLKKRTDPNAEGITYFTWGAVTHNTATEKYIGQLKSIAGPSYSESYTYDNQSRPKTTTITADATYNIDFSYHPTTGLLDSLAYPASTAGNRLRLQYEYSYGIQTLIKDFNSPATVFWKLNDVNARGQYTSEQMGADGYAGKVSVLTGFDAATGLITARQSGTQGSTTNRQNLSYLWDANGNLERRTNHNLAGLYERFEYDELNRLDRSFRNTLQHLDLSYGAIGNIGTKSDVGTYTYHSTKKHAVASTAGTLNNSYGYDANGNMISRNGMSITWNSTNLPATINGVGGVSSQFSYTPNRQRWRQIAGYSGGGNETTIYIAGLMEKLTTASTTYYRHYIPAGSGTIVHTRWGSSSSETYYVTTDHLGSSNVITNSAGALVVSMGFDAFGNRRSADWTSPLSPGDLQAIANTTRHGYTGHEHLDNLTLIHMNGRLQDPAIGRFISADPFVQSPDVSQSYNRYAYVWNNPLTMTDPSGFSPVLCSEGSPDVDCPGSGLFSQMQLFGPAPNALFLQYGIPAIQSSYLNQLAYVPNFDYVSHNSSVERKVDLTAVYCLECSYSLIRYQRGEISTEEMLVGHASEAAAGLAIGVAGVALVEAPGSTIAALRLGYRMWKVRDATRPYNETGLSELSRAWSKHQRRVGSRGGRDTGTFEPLKGNNSQKNATTEQWLRDLLRDPRTTYKQHPSGAYDYRLPNGQGIRFEADGTFDTVLDPPL